MFFSSPEVVVSKLTPCKTRLRSVRYSNDLIIRRVKVADVFGRVVLVRTSNIRGRSSTAGTNVWLQNMAKNIEMRETQFYAMFSHKEFKHHSTPSI
jgi:hypothetical protein